MSFYLFILNTRQIQYSTDPPTPPPTPTLEEKKQPAPTVQHELIIINYKGQSLVLRDYSKHIHTASQAATHTCTHTHTHTTQHNTTQHNTTQHTHTHTHTHYHTTHNQPHNTHTHMSLLTLQNLIYTQLKTGSKQRLETDEDSSTEQKTWQVYRFWGRRNVLRCDLKEFKPYVLMYGSSEHLYCAFFFFLRVPYVSSWMIRGKTVARPLTLLCAERVRCRGRARGRGSCDDK